MEKKLPPFSEMIQANQPTNQPTTDGRTGSQGRFWLERSCRQLRYVRRLNAAAAQNVEHLKVSNTCKCKACILNIQKCSSLTSEHLKHLKHFQHFEVLNRFKMKIIIFWLSLLQQPLRPPPLHIAARDLQSSQRNASAQSLLSDDLFTFRKRPISPQFSAGMGKV